jgi:hypothetical protein
MRTERYRQPCALHDLVEVFAPLAMSLWLNPVFRPVATRTPSSVGSAHVGREVERAASKRKQIIALKVEAAPLTPALEYFLSESQWIDVAALGMPAALTKLKDAVGQGSASTSRDDTVSDVRGSGGPAVDRAVSVSKVAKGVVAAAALVIVLAISLKFFAGVTGILR